MTRGKTQQHNKGNTQQHNIDKDLTTQHWERLK